MGFVKLDVKLDTSFFESLKSSEITEKAFPIAAQGVEAAAAYTQEKWMGYAEGREAILGVGLINKPSEVYAKSIKKRSAGEWAWEVYSDSDIAHYIEYGSGAYDMKNPNYYAGKKSRVASDGSTYLIVPFRWGTPGAKIGSGTMGTKIYSIVRKFKQTETHGTHTEMNANGEAIQRRNVSSGGRLTKADIGANGNKNMAGMIRAKGDRGTKSTRSAYFTFRIISSKSTKGWVKKPVPGKHVTKNLKAQEQQNIQEMISAAFEAQMNSM